MLIFYQVSSLQSLINKWLWNNKPKREFRCKPSKIPGAILWILIVDCKESIGAARWSKRIRRGVRAACKSQAIAVECTSTLEQCSCGLHRGRSLNCNPSLKACWCLGCRSSTPTRALQARIPEFMTSSKTSLSTWEYCYAKSWLTLYDAWCNVHMPLSYVTCVICYTWNSLGLMPHSSDDML